jgi:hypothetical protein
VTERPNPPVYTPRHARTHRERERERERERDSVLTPPIVGKEFAFDDALQATVQRYFKSGNGVGKVASLVLFFYLLPSSLLPSSLLP